ncbi:MAG TPA: tRNA nucleotidyltransferase, partial [Porphyromonadaceae bacterium]|nr:tRNA nucleotidyltransferase [Porphyromonadaceae bacterium]
MDVSSEEIKAYLSNDIFRLISLAADEMQLECYVIGGYVRDFFLCRPSDDIDIVTVGKGIELAESVARKLGKRTRINVYKNFGTAQIKHKEYEIEFVGARKESYSRDSRKPVVEDGTLEDDQK